MQEALHDFSSYIGSIKNLIQGAQNKRLTSTLSALELILSDSQKWKKEYEQGLLEYKAAAIELECLNILAHDIFDQGSDYDDIEKVTNFLTSAEHEAAH